jgi:hypothetical protein
MSLSNSISRSDAAWGL